MTKRKAPVQHKRQMTIQRFPTEKAAEKYAEKELKTVVTDDIHVLKPKKDGPPEGVTILSGVKRPAVVVLRQPRPSRRGLRITPKTPRLSR